MKTLWAGIQTLIAALGGWFGWFLGGWDGFLYALIAFIVIDYLTGLMCAFFEKSLSSMVGLKGIFKKIAILALVGIAHTFDQFIINNAGVIRTAVIFFFISNEGISLLENAARLGLPVPEKLKEALEQLRDKEKKEV